MLIQILDLDLNLEEAFRTKISWKWNFKLLAGMAKSLTTALAKRRRFESYMKDSSEMTSATTRTR